MALIFHAEARERLMHVFKGRHADVPYLVHLVQQGSTLVSVRFDVQKIIIAFDVWANGIEVAEDLPHLRVHSGRKQESTASEAVKPGTAGKRSEAGKRGH